MIYLNGPLAIYQEYEFSIYEYDMRESLTTHHNLEDGKLHFALLCNNVVHILITQYVSAKPDFECKQSSRCENAHHRSKVWDGFPSQFQGNGGRQWLLVWLFIMPRFDIVFVDCRWLSDIVRFHLPAVWKCFLKISIQIFWAIVYNAQLNDIQNVSIFLSLGAMFAFK